MKKAYAKAFGQNIRRLRKEKGLSQEQLAAQLQVAGCGDITRSALAKIEVAQRNLQLYELKVLREVLNVPYDELFINMKWQVQGAVPVILFPQNREGFAASAAATTPFSF